MMGRNVSRSVMMMAVMLGMGSAAQALPTNSGYEPRRLAREGFGVYNPYAPMTYGHRGAGISMAQQQRASQKRKNVKRHRRHVRG